jgi:hypothetical protein
MFPEALDSSRFPNAAPLSEVPVAEARCSFFTRKFNSRSPIQIHNIAGGKARQNGPINHMPLRAFTFLLVLPLTMPSKLKALAIPTSSAPPCGDIIGARATEGTFTVNNMGRSLKYDWDLDVFPWLCKCSRFFERTYLG